MRRALAVLAATPVLLATTCVAAVAGDDAPARCFRANADGDLPTCSQNADGSWTATYPSGAPGGGGFAVLVVVVLLVGLGLLMWKVSLARSMARGAGLDEDRATAVTLLSDDGLGATYLAAGLRGTSPQTAPAAGAAPVRSTADRLRELDDLRAQGLITDEEHAAQRRAVIGSL